MNRTTNVYWYIVEALLNAEMVLDDTSEFLEDLGSEDLSDELTDIAVRLGTFTDKIREIRDHARTN